MKTLIERSSGARWDFMSSPDTSNAINVLRGVSCPTAQSCMAIGYSQGTQNAATLTELWNGSVWSIVPSPSPNNGDLLYGVSCLSATFCVSVGRSLSPAGYYETLAESWNGSSWAVVASPNVGTGSTNNYLNGVSCTTPTACTAVGETTNSHGQYVTLVETWNGTSWTIANSPNAGSSINVLEGVSCTSASSCMSVGELGNRANHGYTQTLGAMWDGALWSIVPTPNTLAIGSNVLSAVACVSRAWCSAVGYDISSGHYQTIAEMWNGTGWTIVPSPDIRNRDRLYSVSCVSTSYCAAVGFLEQRTLIQTWNGTAWSIAPSRNR